MGRPRKQAVVETTQRVEPTPEQIEAVKKAREEHNNSRLNLLNQIADSAEQAGEYHQPETPPDQIPPPEEETPAEEEEAPPPEVPEVPPPAATRKFVVNGQSVELTDEQIAAVVQKNLAADQYLKAAAEIHRQALKQQAPEPKAPEDVVEDDVTLARRLQMGSEDEAAQVIRELRKPRGPSFNPDDLPKIVDERLAFVSAARTLEDNYPDIMGDSVLRGILYEADARLVEQGDTRPYEARYTAIANDIRGWLSTKAKQPPSIQDKQQRKATVTTLPTANARAVVTEEPEESDAQVIASMAKSRGQFIGA